MQCTDTGCLYPVQITVANNAVHMIFPFINQWFIFQVYFIVWHLYSHSIQYNMIRAQSPDSTNVHPVSRPHSLSAFIMRDFSIMPALQM